MFSAKHIIGCTLLAACIATVIFLLPISYHGERNIGAIENISGIPYPILDNQIVISEPLTHTDIFLKEPVLAKQLVLRVTFIPSEIENLSVGVRENSFWLSYPGTVPLYSGQPSNTVIEREIVIPLSDKLQEVDRSIDVMFFTAPQAITPPADPTVTTSQWKLLSLEASVRPALPTKEALKDYLRSILKRERAA